MDDGNNGNPYTGLRDNEQIEFHTNEFELGNYQPTYNLEIIEKKCPFDEWYYDGYIYEYTINQL